MASKVNGALARTATTILNAFATAVGRLDKSLNPHETLARLRAHHFTLRESIVIASNFVQAVFWLWIMESPGFPLKLAIPLLYTAAVLVPLTSQFFVPATPIFLYLLTFYSSRFIPASYRPSISVALLPTLETVLYGANISDILTRFTHPFLDIIAWIPYGVLHFVLPFVVAAFIWLFRPKQALYLWARAFGYMNVVGVITQIILPCAAPWYELIYGLTPANYAMKGSPGGLARIDALFHSKGYQVAFSNAPVVFGAFPSLHAADATIEALFLTHFFPQTTRWVWGYTGLLFWATMYLTHHYLIDVVAGACLATAAFYISLPNEFRGEARLAPPGTTDLSGYRLLGNGSAVKGRNKYEVYDLEAPARNRNGSARGMSAEDFELSEESDLEQEEDITYRSPPPSAAPFLKSGADKSGGGSGGGGGGKKHRHTASIASLIRGDERGPDDGWSPVVDSFPSPISGSAAAGDANRQNR